ncbi:3-phosphoshikimate 1-carboxyvinyltransferase [Neoehrlichia mikurensis]|uniref:5-enolpyruvylshikimate-3-phosphate synthase n=1 Tax=Neoehrlichia mikurensis TaxID=89586 RepID=A0A9Q9BU24_9RICK|nr:3-phosphoshikimate 1-carboxyvinyltransferase [Neoehrlichia mikurensis]QXK92148.1 3-phosphoshikimate 1-carboxyvinyltransferase [Neoehrlichia mikurensis]QXK92605.1 3-phosphoshikimate 1-carboxyvinyltransferase [Neoehrlichia mikurensis]QXK93842.1 3-phosphoshikimate 1-carboxyvinyltransferase [Neoehrlichia mikurensis]UTO55163.1 3-phosphoshikimate 1-carboxyvinyltransferase [Neoehrlichia mikurensis]UTO56083.1 3-phosphoshikimate 1-carboxyvinyltransferase [Neoehrlichia mikurensis]
MKSKKKAISYKVSSINGVANISGDKFISCAALVLASQMIGVTRIYGISICEDVMHMSRALNLLGVEIFYEKSGVYLVKGVGISGLMRPKNALYVGNSMTITYMLLGLLSTYSFKSFFYGSDKLCLASISDIIEPLLLIGSNFVNANLPIILVGSEDSIPVNYTVNSLSHKIKTAMLFAGLNISGINIITEKILTKNHVELFLQYLNADITVSFVNNVNIIKLQGQKELFARDIYIPSDTSLAAFIVAAALIIENSEVIIRNVTINNKVGFCKVLISMGANITLINKKKGVIGEYVADLLVKASCLHGGVILADELSSIIDEYPIISIIAAYINGITTIHGISVLDIEEKNRLDTVVYELNKCGGNAEMTDNQLIIYGSGGNIYGGNVVNVNSDDKIAMSFLILGMVSIKPITINDVECVNSNYSDFISIINKLGGKIQYIK